MISSPIAQSSSLSNEVDIDSFQQLEEQITAEEFSKKGGIGNSLLISNEQKSRPCSLIIRTENIDEEPDDVLQIAPLNPTNRVLDIEKREKQLIKDEEKIRTENEKLNKLRKQLDLAVKLSNGKIDSQGILTICEKYEALKFKYENEREQWEIENKALREKIAKLEKNAKTNRPKVTFIENEEIDKNFIPDDNHISNLDITEDSTSLIFQQPLESKEIHEIPMPIPLPPASPSSINSKKSAFERLSPKSSPSRKKKSTMHPHFHDDYETDFGYNPGPVFREEKHTTDGRRMVRFKDGSRGILYPNGTRKSTINGVTHTLFPNSDVSIDFKDGATAYRFGDTEVAELRLPDGTRLLAFNTGQYERHLPNGDTAVRFPDGKYRVSYADGSWEAFYADGRHERFDGNHLNVSYN